MAKVFDIDEILWQGGCSHKYPTDPEEVKQIMREKRIQREIDERVRRQVLGISDDKEQPPTEEPA